MSDIHVPIVLYYAQNDWLADPKDVGLLIKDLPNLVNSVEIPGWEHLDFIWGLDAAKLVYEPSISYLRKYASVRTKN